ncbi:MAG: hypothetical protein IJQ62_11885 [Clostridia bacterium]|nr:hypothetical protein [Clostridia bacterium]
MSRESYYSMVRAGMQGHFFKESTFNRNYEGTRSRFPALFPSCILGRRTRFSAPDENVFPRFLPVRSIFNFRFAKTAQFSLIICSFRFSKSVILWGKNGARLLDIQPVYTWHLPYAKEKEGLPFCLKTCGKHLIFAQTGIETRRTSPQSMTKNFAKFEKRIPDLPLQKGLFFTIINASSTLVRGTKAPDHNLKEEDA